MKQNNSFQEDTDVLVLDETITEDGKQIVVYNDDHNSFDHVIQCFISVLKHSSPQAEQCAHLIHFKGKCSVKSGTMKELKPLKDGLTDKGLSAVIE